MRPPNAPWNNRVVLFLHGWTGDENIMWIFARKVPVNCWMVAPRGPLKSPEGGYAWAIPTNGRRPDIAQYLENASALIEQLPAWIPEFSARTRLDVVGFSQGAVMTYAMCLRKAPLKAAPLAGYLPPGFSEHVNGLDLAGMQLFIAHNADDRMVSVEESQKAALLFKQHGAQVEYCESTGGHKLSSTCFHGLDNFLRD